ncbi:MAG: hypothetical protein J1G05_04245 [Clostridiales bacterium]|nr:hypothetical protein [Clostridiales bacterium]
MKKVLTIAVRGDVSNLNSEFEEVEIIQADDAKLKKCKSKYTVFLNGGFTYGDLRALLEKAESASADILAFEGGCLLKTSLVKYPDSGTDIFSLQISSILNCKSIERTSLAPFKLSDVIDCDSGALERLKSVVKEYAAAKTKVPVEVYSYARNLICERLVLVYKSYMLAIRNGADCSLLVEFDRDIKAYDMVLYKVFGNRFNHVELEKLRAKSFKISFITAIKYKKELKIN